MARLAARALIIHDNKLLVIKLKEHDTFWCLPGGKVEHLESTEDCLQRELLEELGVQAKIGKLCFIHQGLLQKFDIHLFECLYQITNAEDFLSLDTQASHAFEIYAIHRLSLDNPAPFIRLLPDQILPNLSAALQGEGTICITSRE